MFLSKLNNDLIKIKQLTYQWKISFNPDRTGSADEVILSGKTKDYLLCLTTYQKRLELYLDTRHMFNYHTNEKFGKAMNGIG